MIDLGIDINLAFTELGWDPSVKSYNVNKVHFFHKEFSHLYDFHVELFCMSEKLYNQIMFILDDLSFPLIRIG